ncbi:MAG: LysM peptidoglycan-binding domain-containing protein [Inquilinaceae bacterium]
MSGCNIIPPPQPQPRAVNSASVTVQPGDTVQAIARRYNVPTADLIAANNLRPPYTLQAGQELRLPQPRIHLVEAGDSLYALALRYGVEMEDIARLNNLGPPYRILIGQRLRLPLGSGSATAVAERPVAPPLPPAGRSAGAAPVASVEPAQGPVPARAPLRTVQPSQQVVTATAPPPAPTASAPTPEPAEPASVTAPPPAPAVTGAVPPQAGEGFQWPLVGPIGTSFGATANGQKNDGINILAERGTEVRAAENGVVAYTGNEVRGFGNLLLIRHAGGWVTAYAHLEQILVNRGQTVAAGDVVATVGSSGSVAAPQLHFEIRRGSLAVDPLGQLPPMPARL